MYLPSQFPVTIWTASSKFFSAGTERKKKSEGQTSAHKESEIAAPALQIYRFDSWRMNCVSEESAENCFMGFMEVSENGLM